MKLWLPRSCVFSCDHDCSRYFISLTCSFESLLIIFCCAEIVKGFMYIVLDGSPSQPCVGHRNQPKQQGYKRSKNQERTYAKPSRNHDPLALTYTSIVDCIIHAKCVWQFKLPSPLSPTAPSSPLKTVAIKSRIPSAAMHRGPTPFRDRRLVLRPSNVDLHKRM